MAQGLTNPTGSSGGGGTASTVRAVATRATDVPETIKGATGQTAALTQWLDASGAVKGSVSAAGAVASAAGFLAALTTAQRDALTGVGEGTLIYNSTLARLQRHNGTTWIDQSDVPAYTTANLPAAGPIGLLVYDTTTSQLKVKTAAGNATYAPVGGTAQSANGSYGGDGTSARTISVGFPPKFVHIQTTDGANSWLINTGTTNSLYVPAGSSPQQAAPVISGNGFQLSGAGTVVRNANVSGTTYYWSAFG